MRFFSNDVDFLRWIQYCSSATAYVTVKRCLPRSFHSLYNSGPGLRSNITCRCDIESNDLFVRYIMNERSLSSIAHLILIFLSPNNKKPGCGADARVRKVQSLHLVPYLVHLLVISLLFSSWDVLCPWLGPHESQIGPITQPYRCYTQLQWPYTCQLPVNYRFLPAFHCYFTRKMQDFPGKS